MDIINIILAFLEGLALIASPCILPVLPIILAGSLAGGKKRPLGIVVGFVLAFSLFTFFSREIVRYFAVDLTIVRNVSFGLLFLFGVILLSSYLSEKFSRLTQRIANVGISLTNHAQNEGFFSGMIFGGLVGLIWTPCAGPILAAVILQSVLQETSFVSFLIILAFGIGAAIPMLIIALLGRGVLEKLQFFKKYTGFARFSLGLLIIASVFYMLYSEELNLTFSQPMKSEPNKAHIINGVQPYPAPSIDGISDWINSPPLKLEQLKGKVVLVDFWAYSCINCIRTFPYIKSWYEKYHDKGLVIIGVHSPEFDFEKNLENVKNAVTKYGLRYPVALDNQFVTWRNYRNLYWPAHYLIDQHGNVVYQHFGEGEYEATENNIRFLLGLNKITTAETENMSYAAQTPETYLGFARMENYAGTPTVDRNAVIDYIFPSTLLVNQWALQGKWKVAAEKIVAMQAGAALRIHFQARRVFVVMGNASVLPVQVKVLLNGRAVEQEKGADLVQSAITVKQHELYDVIVLSKASNEILELIAMAPGVEIYTFTFGE